VSFPQRRVEEEPNHTTARKPDSLYSLIETEKLEKMGKKRRVSLNLNKLYTLYCCLTCAKILIRKINKIKRMNGRMNKCKRSLMSSGDVTAPLLLQLTQAGCFTSLSLS
jgi:hypothetical protein